MTQKLYKIRDRNTGLFSTGGIPANWGKEGKIWDNIGHLKTHLAQYIPDLYAFGNFNFSKIKSFLKETKNWEIVEFELKEVESPNINLGDYSKDKFFEYYLKNSKSRLTGDFYNKLLSSGKAKEIQFIFQFAGDKKSVWSTIEVQMKALKIKKTDMFVSQVSDWKVNKTFICTKTLEQTMAVRLASSLTPEFVIDVEEERRKLFEKLGV